MARFGIGGGGRILRGGASVGRGGVRGGVGIGPFSFSGGSRRRGSGSGLFGLFELMGEALWPLFVALFWIAAALLAFGLLGPIALAVTGYLVATRHRLVSRAVKWKRLRRILGLDTPWLSRMHVASLIGAELTVLALSIATNIAISILSVGARGDDGLGDTGLSNVVISVLLANLLLSVPIMITSWIVLFIRVGDPKRLILTNLIGPDGDELLPWTRPTLIAAFSAIVYGIVVGSIGNLLQSDGANSIQDQLTQNIPVAATAMISLASAIQLIRHAEIDRVLYFTTPIALASSAIAFPRRSILQGNLPLDGFDGNFGLIQFVGWAAVVASSAAIAGSIVWNRKQLLWKLVIGSDQIAYLGVACSISLLVALWQSNPYSISAVVISLGPIYASGRRTGRLAPALVLGSICGVTLRCWSVTEFQWDAHWGVLGVAGILFGVLAGAFMIKFVSLSPSDKAPRRPQGTKNEAHNIGAQRSETLTCTECGVVWQRTRTSGRKPSRCTECRS